MEWRRGEREMEVVGWRGHIELLLRTINEGLSLALHTTLTEGNIATPTYKSMYPLPGHKILCTLNH